MRLTLSDLLFHYNLHFRKVSIDRKGVDVNAIGSDPRTDGTHTRSYILRYLLETDLNPSEPVI